MASKKGRKVNAFSIGLVGCGAIAGATWRSGEWGAFTGIMLVAVLLMAKIWSVTTRPHPRTGSHRVSTLGIGSDRLVLDAVPTPMVMIRGDRAHALNLAARHLFQTDDRIVLAPAALTGSDSRILLEGRHWRIDRVLLDGVEPGRSVATLVDIEQEERAAEARVMAEMVHVLGHEMLNGLAPIVSMAESAEAAIDSCACEPELLREILGTLARRAEGLLRFTEGYRQLARLPLPQRSLVSIPHLANDLEQLFSRRWPTVVLVVEVEDGLAWSIDRDQVHQALWALLQNGIEATATDTETTARLQLRAWRTGATMTIDVEDNGAGVATDDVTRIFRPFHTTKPQGTGIGLSLARQIALAHGGSVTLLPRRPTTFRMMFPRPVAAIVGDA